jgi:hypothetical protein
VPCRAGLARTITNHRPPCDPHAGGWAGGEAGLWKLREQVLAEKAAKKAPAPPAAPSKPAVPKPQGGKAPIYLGYSKSDSDLRKAGAPGRFILDDPSKYPAKEDVGFLGGCPRGAAVSGRGRRARAFEPRRRASAAQAPACGRAGPGTPRACP